MKLDLRFSSRPIEELWCSAVVVPAIKRKPLIRGVIGRLNQKLGRHLEKLELAGFFTGRRGETILIPSGDKIKSQKILLKGLGEEYETEFHSFIDMICEACVLLRNLRICDWGVHLPSKIELIPEQFPLFKDAIVKIVDVYRSSGGEYGYEQLKIIFSIPDRTPLMLEGLSEYLHRSMPSQVDFSMVVGV
jgi:hypothetical protein